MTDELKADVVASDVLEPVISATANVTEPTVVPQTMTDDSLSGSGGPPVETATGADDAYDPLAYFSWTVRHRAESSFVNGKFEGRIIIDGSTKIASGISLAKVLQSLRKFAALALASVQP